MRRNRNTRYTTCKHNQYEWRCEICVNTRRLDDAMAKHDLEEVVKVDAKLRKIENKCK